jgi:hypothetical protein
MGNALTALLAGVVILDRPLALRDVGAATEADTCHVLFIPRQSAVPAPTLLMRVATRPVLTIGETPTFLDEGGILNLRVIDGRVRFEVNMASASRAGLGLSSQLLRLALNVRGGSS